MIADPGTLIIRADAGASFGTGHVMRCLALAHAWRGRGGTAVLAYTECPPALVARYVAGGFAVECVRAERGTRADAAATTALALARGARSVVADGYCFDSSWQSDVQRAGLRLLIMDDHGCDRTHVADIVVNAAPGSLESPPEPLGVGRQLLGTRFAMLRPEFVEASPPPGDVPAVATKLLVTFGGSDPENMTEKVLQAVQQLTQLEVTVVAGSSNGRREALRDFAAANPSGVKVECDVANMAALMAAADFCITAAGSTAWELAYMGVPTLLVVVAENQEGIAAAMDRAGVAQNLGHHAPLSPEAIRAAVVQLAGDQPRRRQFARAGRRLVDGHGASRVVAALGAPLRVSLVSDADSWMTPHLEALRTELQASGHAVTVVHDPLAMPRGDIAFLLSLSRIVPAQILRRHAHNIVVHASALPEGRGMSPLTWQILEGKNSIPVSLLEAIEELDAGEVYFQERLQFLGTELIHEMQAAVAASTLRLCRRFVAEYPDIAAQGVVQTGTPSYYPRRRPKDSQLDPDKTLREQFNLLRVADPERYPAYFEINGRRYNVRLTPV